MNQVEVQWVQQRMRGGTPLECWHAHLVKPFVSLEFAWLLRRNGAWHVEVMLGAKGIREVATYGRADTARKHVERWIALERRCGQLVLARGAEDPRGAHDRFAPTRAKHRLLQKVRNLKRGGDNPFRTKGPGD